MENQLTAFSFLLLKSWRFKNLFCGRVPFRHGVVLEVVSSIDAGGTRLHYLLNLLKNKHLISRKKNNFRMEFGNIRLELPQIQLSHTAWTCWEYKCNYCKFVQTDLLHYLANLTYGTFCVHIADGNSKLTWQSDCVMWLLCLEVVRGQQSLGLGSVGFFLNSVGYFFTC